MSKLIFTLLACVVALPLFAADKIPVELRVGEAGHAFDHLGNIGEQADAAAASGVTIIYATGLGGLGYMGLPSEKDLSKEREKATAYNHSAKSKGIRLSIGYICATSIVKLDTFDKNWSSKFRTQFRTPPDQWRQVGKDGKPLPSWYGGDYQPACMNNPDWQTYEKFMVTQQIQTGHDGIFFDNPTVHPQGCYCQFCMKKFADFLADKSLETNSIAALRDIAAKRSKEFLKFRSTIARDFLSEMRKHARTINSRALITCNNSLNSPEVFFSQNRDYGYNIYEMTKAEDFVVVEDSNSQPRTLPKGTTFEYGHVYKLLHAINHGKPIVAVTIADVDYHTAPNLVRLAMAEAVAANSSYLSWPTWPENVRSKMISGIQAQADFLRQNQKLLNDAPPRSDVLLFLPFQRWLDTADCAALPLAAALTRANVQYKVVCEDEVLSTLKTFSGKDAKPVLLLESESVLNAEAKQAVRRFVDKGGKVVAADKANWLKDVQSIEPSIVLSAPATIRAVVHDQSNRTIVHLYNLNVQKLSSYDDKVTPAENVRVSLRVPMSHIKSVKLLTADNPVFDGTLEFTSEKQHNSSFVDFTVPKLTVSSLVVIE